MTSGVKQALPQVLMPKIGVDGKAARNRMPQGDFAEALGMAKQTKPPKPGDAKPNQLEDVRPAWPRLASKLDAIDRTQAPAMRFETPALLSEDTKEEHAAADDRPEARAETGADRISVSAAMRDALVAFPAPAPPSTPADVPGATPAEHPDLQIATDAPPSHQDQPVLAHHELELGNDKVSFQASSGPVAENSGPAAEKPAPTSFTQMDGVQRAEPIRHEPTAGPLSTAAEKSPTPPERVTEALTETPAEPAKTAPRVTVLAQQNIPAPMPSTTLVLVESIAASDLIDQAAKPLSLEAIQAPATHTSAQSLKIQLHPAELGMVTATLRFAGERLSIELQVENHGAYRRLASDSDTIVGSLRDLGYDIDRVTVLQPSVATLPASRVDAAPSMPSPQGRSSDQFDPGQPGGGSGGRSQEDGGNQRQGRQSAALPRKEDPGRGVYI